jgi:hypothetical protein
VPLTGCVRRDLDGDCSEAIFIALKVTLDQSFDLVCGRHRPDP